MHQAPLSTFTLGVTPSVLSGADKRPEILRDCAYNYSIIAGDREGYNHDVFQDFLALLRGRKKKKTKFVSLSKVS